MVTLKCFQSVVGKNIRAAVKAQMQGILTSLAVTYLLRNIVSQPYLREKTNKSNIKSIPKLHTNNINNYCNKTTHIV